MWSGKWYPSSILTLTLGEAKFSETSVTTDRNRFVLKKFYIQTYFHFSLLTEDLGSDGMTFSRILKKYI